MTNLTPEAAHPGPREREPGPRHDPPRLARWPPPPPRPWRGFYFGYKEMGDKPPVRAAIIGTGDEGCQAMIRVHNRDYLDFIGFCDIRPSQQERAVKEFSNHKQYTAADVKKLKKYDDQGGDARRPRRRDGRHRAAALAARPGGHRGDEGRQARLREKLMAHTVAECKEMCRVARETNKLLAIGHQRHYSVLYDNANYLVQNGLLGDIRHIRALWHRNNAQPLVAKDKDGKPIYDPKTGLPEYVRDDKGNIVYLDSWKPTSPSSTRRSTSPSTATRASTSWSAGGSTTAPARA